jgi:hypothetical protein
MAGKVFFSVSMSLDGFVAPESHAVGVRAMEGFIAPGERRDDLDVQRWMAQWMQLQAWIFPQRFFRENLNLGEGGEEGRDNDIARETFERTGSSVMGKRMFDLGEQAWPEEAPFHNPRVRPHPPAARPLGTAGRDHVPLRQRRHPQRAGPGSRRRRRPGRPHRRRQRDDLGVPERRPGRRVLDRALTGAFRRRHPPIRQRGRVQGRAGAGPFGAVVAGDAPDLRRASTVAAPHTPKPRLRDVGTRSKSGICPSIASMT